MIEGRYLARFPIIGLAPIAHLKRSATQQLAAMLAGVEITGDWEWTITKNARGDRLLVASAPARTTLPANVVEARRAEFEAAIGDTPQLLPLVRRAA